MLSLWSKSKVKTLIDSGMTKEEIREAYFPMLNKNQWLKALKQMGLSSVRSKKVDFAIADDDENVAEEQGSN
jgi:hypothetical protein